MLILLGILFQEWISTVLIMMIILIKCSKKKKENHSSAPTTEKQQVKTKKDKKHKRQNKKQDNSVENVKSTVTNQSLVQSQQVESQINNPSQLTQQSVVPSKQVSSSGGGPKTSSGNDRESKYRKKKSAVTKSTEDQEHETSEFKSKSGYKSDYKSGKIEVSFLQIKLLIISDLFSG